ncbi:hypothetical protein QQF64_026283 [Cirrhinus molitorella]|uniref:Uncharacterized protein n=1 Tax=Cirrhinus molitorella TaxID=172907 RepID=A0ABR3NSS6_9TELE
MKRREPPLTSSGVKRRARISLEKRLHDIAEDCLLEPEPTHKDDVSSIINDTQCSNDSGLPQIDDNLDNSFPDCTDDGVYDEVTERHHVSEPDSESESECVDEPVSLVESLANWAVQFGVSLVALTALLSLLRLYHPDLPKDARSILKTTTDYKIEQNYANTLLTTFVSHVGELYGQDALVYNVHALVYLSADAQLHGSLDSISPFPYENYLRTLKKFVRKPEFPLAQIIRRLSEVEESSNVELPCKGDYLKAREKMRASLTCNTSELQTDDEEVIRKRKIKQRQMFCETDSDSEPEGGVKRRYKNVSLCPAPTIPPPTPDVPSKKIRQTSVRPLLHLKQAGSSSFNAPPVPFNTFTPSSPLHHSSVGHVPDLTYPEDDYMGT